MKNLKTMKEQRGALVREADNILRAASTEKRSVTNTEDFRLEGITREIFDLDQTILREQRTIDGLVNSRSNGEMDLSGYSLTRAINCAANGRLDGLELEISQELSQRSGVNPNGFFIPNQLLQPERRSGMSVTLDGGAFGGNTVATEVFGFLEALRPVSKVIAAGATLFSGLSSNISIPKLTSASVASWKDETAALTESTPGVGQVELSPKRVGSFVELSNQLLIQSTPSIENFIRRDLLAAVGMAIDAAAINGAGGTAPTGILGTSGIGDVAGGTNGAAPTWAHIVALVGKIADANADLGTLAFLTNSKVISKLRSTAKVTSTDSQMLLEGERLLNHLVHSSNNIPSNLTKGSATGICSALIFCNAEDILIGSFGLGTDIIVDRFSKATNGITRIVANSYVDCAIRRAESFAAMQDVLTA